MLVGSWLLHRGLQLVAWYLCSCSCLSWQCRISFCASRTGAKSEVQMWWVTCFNQCLPDCFVWLILGSVEIWRCWILIQEWWLHQPAFGDIIPSNLVLGSEGGTAGSWALLGWSWKFENLVKLRHQRVSYAKCDFDSHKIFSWNHYSHSWNWLIWIHDLKIMLFPKSNWVTFELRPYAG